MGGHSASKCAIILPMKLISSNRKAYHEFKIEDTYEVGIALMGTEVKALREGKANLNDAFAKLKNSEVFLINAHISPYSCGNINNHEPKRDRKLLMHRFEIHRISSKVKERGYTLVPLKLYFNDRNCVKLEIGLAKGKTSVDKRHDIKAKDEKRINDREGRMR
jgi:SsrA-binding protein